MNTKSVHLTRSLIALSLALLLALPFASPASAGEVIPGNPNASVGPDEVIDDDLFISGQRVTIDGTVLGEVFAAGQEIIVNGTIEGNLIAAGQVITINGTVEGSLFGAGYSLELGPEANIAGSSFFGGFAFMTAEGSQIARTLYMGGYQADLSGEIGRDVIAGLGAIRLDGSVDGDVLLELGQSRGSNAGPEEFTFYIPGNVTVLPEGIEETDNSVIGGQLDYSVSSYQVEVPNIDNPSFGAEDVAGAFVANAVRTRVGEFFALLIVGALFFHFMSKRSSEVMQEYEENPFANLGWGTLVALLLPLVFVLSILVIIALAIFFGIITLGQLVGTVLSLGGLTISAIWVFAGIVFWMLSKVLFAYFVGDRLLERLRPETLSGRWATVIILALGLLIYEILRAIPLLGWVFALLVILAGVGAFFQVARNAWIARRAS